MTTGESTWTLELPYRRSLGPVVGAFLTGLRDGRILGTRTSAGRVLVPPLEYDPDTGDAVDDDLVEVGPSGVVRHCSWVVEPLRKHPFAHPFAWALVQLDGADTAMVHAVDVGPAGDAGSVRTGMRVRVRWRDERRGH
ncbi:MAG: OB-fold domain-containing protein, partial [Actinomycetota bacterium]|nr:OB-fold domain-containing protein [Actinomycetota bacterium]